MSDIYLPPELAGPTYGLNAEQLRLRGDATSAAIEAALSPLGTDWTRVLRIPAGFTKIDGANRVHEVCISRPINMNGLAIRGSLESTAVPSRIRAVAPMDRMVFAVNSAELSDVQLDGNGMAVLGLDGQSAHDAVFSRLQVVHCTSFGIHLKDSFSRCRWLYIAGNGKGGRFVGCTGMTLEDCNFLANQGQGLEVVGISSGLTTGAGGLHMKNGTVDGNGIDGTSPQVWLDGVEGGSMRDVYIEGAGPQGGSDGIRMRSKCHAFSASGLHFVTKGFTVNAESARGCVFRDCTAPLQPGGGSPKARVARDIVANVDAGYDVDFIACRTNSYADPRPWTIEHWLGSDPVWAYEARADGMYASGPPPGTLRFRQGTRVRNKAGPGAWAQTTWSADGGFLWAAD